MTSSPAATADAVAPELDGQDERVVVPPDTFGMRVAIARTYLRMNLDRLSDACVALGVPINSETIRRWEHHMTQCTDPIRAAKVIGRIQPKDGRPPLDWRWIAFGGPMPAEQMAPRPGPDQEVLTHWREVLGDSDRRPSRKVA